MPNNWGGDQYDPDYNPTQFRKSRAKPKPALPRIGDLIKDINWPHFGVVRTIIDKNWIVVKRKQNNRNYVSVVTKSDFETPIIKYKKKNRKI